MSTTHTPLPWRAEWTPGEYSQGMILAGEFVIAEVYGQNHGQWRDSPDDGESEFQANAEHIVKCVNSHDALVDKARELANVAQDTTKDIIGFAGAERLDRAIDDIRALLSQLEAGK